MTLARINSSSRSGDDVTLNYTVQPIANIVNDDVGGAGAVTETRTYFRRAPNNTVPSTGSIAGWTLKDVFPGTGGGNVPTANFALGCSGVDANRDDLWLATGIVVSGDVILGKPVSVECGGNLADPTGGGRKKLTDTVPRSQTPQ